MTGPGNPPTMVNGFDNARLDQLPEELRAAVARRNRVLGPVYRLFYADPVEIVRGAGTYLYDAAGNEYLDAYNNVPCVGHAHPRVADAMARQAATAQHPHPLPAATSVLDYAEDLLSTFRRAAEQHRVHLHRVGGQRSRAAHGRARDRQPRGHRHRERLPRHHAAVTAHLAVAGRRLAARTSACARFRRPIDRAPPPGRSATTGRAGPCGHRRLQRRHGVAAGGVHRRLALLVRRGVQPDPTGLLAPVAEAVHRAGGLYIADEVQSGLRPHRRGAVGLRSVTASRPTSSPWASRWATATRWPASSCARACVDGFGREMRYFNTFGGNPVAVAAAQAVLDVLRDEELIENAAQVGAQLKAGVEALSQAWTGWRRARRRAVHRRRAGHRRPAPARSRHRGRRRQRVTRRRVLISASGPDGNVLKIRPPLAFRSADADRFLTDFEAALTPLR